jgi:hypothetical protein
MMIHSGGAFFGDYFGPIHYESDALLLRVRGLLLMQALLLQARHTVSPREGRSLNLPHWAHLQSHQHLILPPPFSRLPLEQVLYLWQFNSDKV